jgi:hypothetical protein
VFLFYALADSTAYTPDLHFKVDALVSTGEIPDSASLPVIETPVYDSTDATCCFFSRRSCLITKA